MHWQNYKSEIQPIDFPLLKEKNIQISILREDMIHPEISGNKYRKLKYNFIKAKELGFRKVLTFGGAFSNHIAATSVAARLNGFESLGFIRGEEIESIINDNPTLAFAQEQGMIFNFVSREEYREKDSIIYLKKLKEKYPDYYIIPEGGTNEEAIKGCEEILHEGCDDYDFITCAIGTAGTVTGLINSKKNKQQILGFPALKGDFFSAEIRKLTQKENYTIIDKYHFGGYGKVSEDLINFINSFKKETNIPLDPIYTGKMMYGLIDLIKNDYFSSGSKILFIHTGGLQGIKGINKLLTKKNKTIIQ